jgi:putative membrane protein
MKSISGLGWSLILLVSAGCDNGNGDSVKQAEKENQYKADSLQKEKAVDSSTVIPSQQDAYFLVKAYSGGMMEIELGKLAMSHAAHQGVKEFGAMMVQDHGMDADTLRTLALSKKIVLPDSISNGQKKDRDNLMKKHGLEFDRSYISMMVRDHKDDIDEFQKQARNANDPDIRAFAQRNLAMLQQHLDSAQRLDKRVGRSLSGSNMVPPN